MTHLPKSMRAIGLTESLSIDNDNALFDFDAPTPQPTGRDVLVAIEAIAVNPVDCKQRSVAATGEPLAIPKILGWDAVGRVVGLGDAACNFALNDRVYYAGSIACAGVNAQYHTVDERLVAHAPRTLSNQQAAALPLTALTAWEALFERLAFVTDGAQGTLLIINGAGGVGSIATQLASHAGLTVIATASRPETTDWCKKMGATEVISHKMPLQEQLDALGIGELDAVCCCVAPDTYLRQLAGVLKPQGAICTIVDNEQPLDMKCLKPKSISFHFEFMFTKSLFTTADMASQGDILTRVAALVDAGKISSTVDTVLSPICAATLKQAHKQLESGSSIGKIVVHGWGT